MSQQQLPEGWKWTKLSNITEIIMGQSPPSSSYNDRGIGLPFFQGKAEFGDIYPVPQKWCTVPSKSAEPNDILLSVRAPVGPTNLAYETCCIGRGLAALRAKHNLHYMYLFYYLKWIESELERYGQMGSTFNAITKEQIENVEIALPSLPVQRVIVTILNKVDSILHKQGKIQRLIDNLSLSLFIDIFGDPVINPKKWEIVRLGDVIKPIGGGTPSKNNKAFWNGHIPWISPKDMKDEEIWDASDHISEEALYESSTSLIEPGSVLLVVRSGVLKHSLPIAINRTPVCINQDLKAVAPSDKLTSEYLFVTLKHLEKMILAQCVRVGSTVHNIDSKKLFDIKITLPPVLLQRAFTDIFVNYRSDQRRITSHITESSVLSPSILTRAFTGELTKEWEAVNAEPVAVELARLERRPRLALLYLIALCQKRRSEPIGITCLMKYAFLAQKQGDIFSQPTNYIYDFIPYHFGPFAQEIYKDLTLLEQDGWIKVERTSDIFIDTSERTGISLNSERISELEIALTGLNDTEHADLEAIIARYGDLSLNELLETVYIQYPAYTYRSRLRKAVTKFPKGRVETEDNIL